MNVLDGNLISHIAGNYCSLRGAKALRLTCRHLRTAIPPSLLEYKLLQTTFHRYKRVIPLDADRFKELHPCQPNLENLRVQLLEQIAKSCFSAETDDSVFGFGMRYYLWQEGLREAEQEPSPLIAKQRFEFLVRAESHNDQREDSLDPLLLACRERDHEKVKTLLEAGHPIIDYAIVGMSEIPQEIGKPEFLDRAYEQEELGIGHMMSPVQAAICAHDLPLLKLLHRYGANLGLETGVYHELNSDPFLFLLRHGNEEITRWWCDEMKESRDLGRTLASAFWNSIKWDEGAWSRFTIFLENNRESLRNLSHRNPKGYIDLHGVQRLQDFFNPAQPLFQRMMKELVDHGLLLDTQFRSGTPFSKSEYVGTFLHHCLMSLLKLRQGPPDASPQTVKIEDFIQPWISLQTLERRDSLSRTPLDLVNHLKAQGLSSSPLFETIFETIRQRSTPVVSLPPPLPLPWDCAGAMSPSGEETQGQGEPIQKEEAQVQEPKVRRRRQRARDRVHPAKGRRRSSRTPAGSEVSSTHSLAATPSEKKRKRRG